MRSPKMPRSNFRSLSETGLLGDSLAVLTLSGKPETPVGKSSGSRHSVWEALKSMGCDLSRRNFCSLLSLLTVADLNL